MLTTILKDVAPYIIKYSPTLASMLGSPLAGFGLSLLTSMFGTDIKNPKDIVDNILSNVDQACNKLSEVENNISDTSDARSFLNLKKLAYVKASIKFQFDEPPSAA